MKRKRGPNKSASKENVEPKDKVSKPAKPAKKKVIVYGAFQSASPVASSYVLKDANKNAVYNCTCSSLKLQMIDMQNKLESIGKVAVTLQDKMDKLLTRFNSIFPSDPKNTSLDDF